MFTDHRNDPRGAGDVEHASSLSPAAIHLSLIARDPSKWGSREIAAYIDAERRDVARQTMPRFADLRDGGNLAGVEERAPRWPIVVGIILAGLFGGYVMALKAIPQAAHDAMIFGHHDIEAPAVPAGESQ
jgi:hypothetical protein